MNLINYDLNKTMEVVSAKRRSVCIMCAVLGNS
jgi:hypothetical protein